MRIAIKAFAAGLAALATLPAAASAAEPAAGHFRYAIDTAAGSADYSLTSAREHVVILQSYQVARMQSLKAANPNLKVLIYKDLSGMVERDQWGGVSTGVATQDAAAHPEWFLLNTSGQRFTFRYYNWIWAADIGNAAFQQKWADNVLAEIGTKGWDGVFMDDTNPSMDYHYDVASVAKYPTDAAYQAATGSALAAIGARFRAAGKLVVPNFGFWKDYPSVINGWLQHVDGGMNENFVKVGTTTAPEGYDRASVWETQLQSIKDAEAQDKLYLGVSHSPNSDRAAARYGFATTLLGGDGHTRFALHGDYTHENWFEEYDYKIGTPAAAETRDASGVHRRTFTNGLVLVNPTTAAVSVQFGGAYTGVGLTGATGTTLQPRSALILAKAGEGAPFRDPATGTDGPSSTPTPSPGPSPTPSPTPSPSPSPTPSPSPSPTVTPTPTATPAPTPTVVPTPIATPVPTPVATPRRARSRSRSSASCGRPAAARWPCGKGRRSSPSAPSPSAPAARSRSA